MTEVTDLGSQIASTHENSSYIYNKIKLAMQTMNNHNGSAENKIQGQGKL